MGALGKSLRWFSIHQDTQLSSEVSAFWGVLTDYSRRPEGLLAWGQTAISVLHPLSPLGPFPLCLSFSPLLTFIQVPSLLQPTLTSAPRPSSPPRPSDHGFSVRGPLLSSVVF